MVVALCGGLALGRLLIGGLALAAARSTGLRGALAAHGRWAHGLLVAARARPPVVETLAELGLGLLTIGLGATILISGRRDRSARLFGLALLAAGGTGNLWTQATVSALRESAGLSRLATGDLLLPSVAVAAFAFAFLSYPTARSRLSPRGDESLPVIGGSAVLGAAAATLLEPTSASVVLFGVAVPALGLLLLRLRGRDDLTTAERTQIRLVSAVLAGAAAIVVMLLVIAVPVFHLRVTALLFWFSHLVPVAVVAGAFAAGRRDRLHANQRRFGIALVIALVGALIGGLFVILHTLVAAPIAALPAALLLRPTFVRARRWVDRLLYGRRPTPYSVLAGIGTVSWASPVDGPDLARVAEAVGEGLGARVCRLIVHRPDRPDRAYTWSQTGADEGYALITLPIVRGDERLGSITVDRATATGLNVHRHRLVEDIADSLGAVLEASRLGIELERQLRAVRAHAADIAGSRRRLVAEMDAERRRIERDLHDGAQHHLVSLRLSLGLAEHRLTTGSAEAAMAALDRVTAQIDDAESIMARTATGVTSPRLAQYGLVAALEAELAVPVTTRGMEAGRRFPAHLESAVWFCCLEAVNNARKHAPGAPIRLTLTCAGERLEFGVQDDGPGWDLAATGASPGRGLGNVMARVRAVDGAVSAWSEPGAGTRIDGWVPLPDSRSLVGAVREAIEDTLTRYGDTPTAEKIRQVRADLDRPATRRGAILTAGSVLRVLDGLVRGEPPATGAARLLHRFDRIRSGTHEVAEVDAIDTLRSDAGDLDPEEVETAARLLGESGPDAHSRLGLEPAADRSLVAAAAEQAVVGWRARASHPGTSRSLRVLAATVVRSCERLLSPPR
jgi:signal transduction histidine kinase